MRGSVANVLRVCVMAALCAVAAVAIFAPREEPVIPPPPPEPRLHDLGAIAASWRRDRLGTLTEPIGVPQAPATCTAHLVVLAETSCDAPDGPGTIEGSTGACALATVDGVRRFTIELPPGASGTLRCAVGACASVYLRVAPDVRAVDPIVSGRWSVAEVACPTEWPGGSG